MIMIIRIYKRGVRELSTHLLWVSALRWLFSIVSQPQSADSHDGIRMKFLRFFYSAETTHASLSVANYLKN